MKNMWWIHLFDKIAFFIAALSSPYLVLAAASFLVIGANTSNRNDLITWYALFATYVSLIPLVFVYSGVRHGSFTDIHVMIREQRNAPIIVGLISSVVLTGIYYALDVPGAILAMSISVVICGVLSLAITQYWKISIHTGSLASTITILGILVNSLYWYLLMLLPFVIWSRTRRGRHSIWQTVGGAGLGILCSYGICAVFGLL